MPSRRALGVLLILGATSLAGCVGSPGSADLDSANATVAGARPHVHDRWVDPTDGSAFSTLAVVDRTVTVQATTENRTARLNTCQQTDTRGAGLCLGRREFHPGTWPDETPKIVPPGTTHLTLNVTFEDPEIRQVRLFYQDAKSRGLWEQVTNETHGGPYTDGGGTRTLNVTLKEADDGHAQISRWRFVVEIVGRQIAPDQTPTEADVSVRIVAHRTDGDLPLEPAHPPFFTEDTPSTHTYIIGDIEAQIQDYVQAYRVGYDAGTGYFTFNSHGVNWEVPTGFEGRRIWDKGRYPPKVDSDYRMQIVPPDTRLLVAHVEVETEGDPLPGPEVCLYGQDRPGGGYPGQKLDDCAELTPGEPMVFKRRMTPRDTDSLYTPKNESLSFSRWTFFLMIRAPDRTAMDFTGDVRAQLFITDRDGFELPPWATGDATGGNATASY